MQEFLESLTALGYAIPNLNLDGKIHRFNRDGKSNGWYVGWQNHYIKGDGTYIVAVFGDWKTGEHHTYKPTKRMTREDSAVIKEQLERARRASEEERVTKQNDAAIEAEKVWRNISTSNQGVSDYATRKMISSMRGVAVDGEGTIFIPMRDINGKLWGCQRIFQDGSKRFLFGQKVVGTFHSIGAISDETTDVYICEGWATGDAIHAATQATVIVSFNAGNLKTVARDIHLNYPMARITICADNDRFTKTGNIGIDKANEAATVCHGVVKIPQFTNPEKGTDFNDLLVQEGAESVRDQLTEKEEPSTGFAPLGYDGHDYYFYRISTKDIVCLTTFSPIQLYALAPAEYWFGAFPSKMGVAWDQVKNHLVTMSVLKGTFDWNRCRGPGVWMDSGRVVVNTGNYLHVDGRKFPLCSITSKYYYTNGRQALIDLHPEPMPCEESAHVTDICDNLVWSDPKSGYLLAGWIAIARIAGALKVRPHVWLTGGSGVGKTTVMDQFIQYSLGCDNSRLYVAGNTTEPAIRQAVRGYSKPVIFDEFEISSDTHKDRVNNVIEMLRQAWSDSSAKVIKGSGSGRAEEFTVKFSALVSSIRVTLTNDADKSRFSVLELNPHGGDPEQWARLSKMIEKIDEDYGERLFARMVHMVPVVARNFEIIRKVLAGKMGARYADQTGMLLAGYWALRQDEPVTPQIAESMMGDLNLGSDKADTIPDERECLDHLMTKKVAYTQGSAPFERVEKNFSEIIRSRDYDGLQLLPAYGMLVDNDTLFIASTNNELSTIFSKTRWVNWNNSLKRLPGAERALMNNKKIHSRGIKIPVSII